MRDSTKTTLACIKIFLFYRNVFYIIELQSNRLLMEEHIKDYFFFKDGTRTCFLVKKTKRETKQLIRVFCIVNLCSCYTLSAPKSKHFCSSIRQQNPLKSTLITLPFDFGTFYRTYLKTKRQ